MTALPATTLLPTLRGGKLYGKAGSTITLTAEPSAGQMVTGWQFSDNTIVDTGNSFIMPEHAVTVRAVFGDIVASVRVGDTVSNYVSLTDAFSAANSAEGSTLKLLANVTAAPTLEVTGSFTLDLNGKTLTMGGNSIKVNGGLTLKGAVENSIITGNAGELLGVGSEGTLTIESGAIVNTSNGDEDYVVKVENGGTATIQGGVIRGRNCVDNAGTLEITQDGILEVNCPGCNGLCVFNAAGGTVTITGGTLKKQAGSNIFNTATGITLTGGSFPNGIIFWDESTDTLRSLLKDDKYAFYDLDAYTNQAGTQTLVSVDNERTNIDRGVVVLEHLEHTFSCTIIEGDRRDTKHLATCGCGYSETVNHDFEDNNGFCKACDAYEPAHWNGDAYEISNAGQLFWFGNYDSNANAKLMADINASYTDEGTLNKRMWLPIACGDFGYSGTFDGNGKTVSGLIISPDRGSYTSTNVGFFGKVSGGTIKNLTIADCGVNETLVKDNSNIAILCGYLEGGTIEGCTNQASLGITSSGGRIAGICGVLNGGEIRNCTNSAELSHGSAGVAGICYENNGTISDCTNTGNINGNSAGGICVNNGYDGNGTASIQNCANRGQISGNIGAGGICAINYGTVSNCYHLNVSPIVGWNQQDDSFSNCYYLAEQATANPDGTMAKTAAQFASGEVAYLLNENPSGGVRWGQDIGKQNYPVLIGPHVYRHASSCPTYSNDVAGSSNAHTPAADNNSICQECGAALVATVKIADEGFHGYVTLADAFTAANRNTATITLLRDAKIGEDEILTISSGEVTFRSAENHAEGSTFYTITLNRPGIAIYVQENGTFNFESGILQFTDYTQQNGIQVNGGTLNFKGGTIAGSDGRPSIGMNSGTVNISGGTVGLVDVFSGTLNISDGTVNTLQVTDTKTSLIGGSFHKIQRVTGGTVIFTLLADGYAYYRDGAWVYVTDGDDAMKLEGDIRVRSIPVSITKQPEGISFTYGEDKSLSVSTAATETEVSYEWYQVTTGEGEVPMEHPVGTGDRFNLSGLNAGSYKFFCRLTCDGYVLNSDTVTVDVARANSSVTITTVPNKTYSPASLPKP